MLENNASLRVLHPGDVACVERGVRLQTLLGSCVSVVMTDPQRTVGAMCHIVHAHGRSRGAAIHHAQAETAWGNAALDAMYALLRRRGFTPRLCQAWVYGGGNMFPRRGTGPDVGAANARWVMEALALDGVRVLCVDVGGSVYRKVTWAVGSESPQVQSVALEGQGEVLLTKPWEDAGDYQCVRGR
jgi:chemotaxis protein CheD